MTIRLSTKLTSDLMDTAPFKTALDLCFIDIYSGVQPASANLAPTGTKLVTLSNASGVTGLTWGPAAADGVLSKTVGEIWSGNAVASGTAGYFRIRLAADDNSNDSTNKAFKRVDGSIGTSGADMNIGSLTVTSGAPFIASNGSFTLPTS